MTVSAVALARGWIGTPYVHQASVQGVACDCLGLLRGVWRGLYGSEPEVVPPYTPDWSEPQGDERLMTAALRHLRPAGPQWVPGQVLLFRMRRGAVAKHIGLLSEADDRPAFIHAYTGHGVVESPLSEPWRRRVVARFEFPLKG
jgi:NlpC/P60 family putative phage cell wall peptidase